MKIDQALTKKRAAIGYRQGGGDASVEMAGDNGSVSH